MSETAQALQKQGPQTLKQLLNEPAYQKRFAEMLGTKRAPQFIASIMNAASSRHFQGVEPKSIIAAAAVAATLDLTIDKNLGLAWIIPYNKMAQFQLGWKGVVQLALRSGQYAGMNAFKVNAEALGGYDAIGDPIILFDKLDKTKEAVGYAFSWRLLNGFTKIVYWTKAEVEAHARRYSQAYKANRKDFPWFTDFDKMALKTVVMNALRSWGILSVEMRQAVVLDQSAAMDIEAEPMYIDNGEGFEEETANNAASLAEQLRTEREAESADGAQTIAPAKVKEIVLEGAQPVGARGLLEDAYLACKEAHSDKTAKDALETATGFRTTPRVPDELIETATAALLDRAKRDI